jgi:hypothetical protein
MDVVVIPRTAHGGRGGCWCHLHGGGFFVDQKQTTVLENMFHNHLPKDGLILSTSIDRFVEITLEQGQMFEFDVRRGRRRR